MIQERDFSGTPYVPVYVMLPVSLTKDLLFVSSICCYTLLSNRHLFVVSNLCGL